MLKKRLGIEAIEINWNTKIDYIYDYFKIPTSLIIPDGCKRIGNSAFECCKSLREVIIPKSVKWIDGNAFSNCKKLEKVIISEGVEEIWHHAFDSCDKLKKVVIPKSVERIGYKAFCHCRRATIILKKPLKKFKFIGSCALLGCRDVEEETRT